MKRRGKGTIIRSLNRSLLIDVIHSKLLSGTAQKYTFGFLQELLRQKKASFEVILHATGKSKIRVTV